MPLILAPSYDEQTREQIEHFLEGIQARRMTAAVEYHQGKQAKLHHESDKIQAKVEKAYATLLRRIEASDKADAACAEALAKCEALKQELGLVMDMIDLDDPQSEE